MTLEQPHRHRVDDPRRLAVARRRVVAQLELSPRVVASRITARWAGSRRSTRSRPRPPSTASSLATARASGAVGIGAGHRQDGPGRGGEGETLGRGESPGAAQLGAEVGDHLLVVDDDLHELVGRVRGQAATRGELEIGDELIGVEPEALGELRHRGPALARQPGEHRQQAQQPRAGIGTGRHGGPATASSQDTTPARTSSGPTTSAWSPNSKSHDRRVAMLVTSRCSTTDPSAWRGCQGDSPTSSRPGRPARRRRAPRP